MGILYIEFFSLCQPNLSCGKWPRILQSYCAKMETGMYVCMYVLCMYKSMCILVTVVMYLCMFVCMNIIGGSSVYM